MKNLHQLCAAVVLTLVLAASAFAGTMHTGITNPPPIPQGTMHTGVAGSSPEGDAVAEIMLNLLQSALSLF